MTKEKDATWTRFQGALCSVVLLCQCKMSRCVKGTPITISFYMKSREIPKEKRKLIFVLQKKATHSYRRSEFPIFQDFVLLVLLLISIWYFKHSSEYAINLASETVTGSNLPMFTRTYSLKTSSRSRKWRPRRSWKTALNVSFHKPLLFSLIWPVILKVIFPFQESSVPVA